MKRVANKYERDCEKCGRKVAPGDGETWRGLDPKTGKERWLVEHVSCPAVMPGPRRHRPPRRDVSGKTGDANGRQPGDPLYKEVSPLSPVLDFPPLPSSPVTNKNSTMLTLQCPDCGVSQPVSMVASSHECNTCHHVFDIVGGKARSRVKLTLSPPPSTATTADGMSRFEITQMRQYRDVMTLGMRLKWTNWDLHMHSAYVSLETTDPQGTDCDWSSAGRDVPSVVALFKQVRTDIMCWIPTNQGVNT